MNKLKRRFSIPVALSLTLAMLITGCSNGKSSSSTASTASTQKPVTIKAYIADADYNKQIIQKFEDANPNITVNLVPCDYTNCTQVIKTGISSGNPVDVAFNWGTSMSTYVNSKMALDLTPYLKANNSQWYNTFIQKYIDAGKINGKNYCISYQPVIETLYYNKDLFDKYNIKVPTTWSDYMSACETFKKDGIYGAGSWAAQNHQMLVFAYQEMAAKGNIANVVAGKVPFSSKNDVSGFTDCLTALKNLYQNNYWYPGQGALTATQDQVQAAWYQGKIATLFDAGSSVGTYEKNCKFKVGIMKYPLINSSAKYAVNVVTNALFVPANAKNKAEAIKFLKFYTSETGETILMNSGRLPDIKSMESKITDQTLKDLLATTTDKDSVGYTQLQSLSDEMSDYVTNQVIGEACSGRSMNDIFTKMEQLRKDAVSKS